MSIKRKALLIQAVVGGFVLTLLMQPVFMLGYGPYLWISFTSLIIFFALGADFKNIPSMIVSFVFGLAWGVLNGIVSGALSGAPMWVSGILWIGVMIFLVLTVHINLFGGTLIGNVPSMFMGLALTFYLPSVQGLPHQINVIHLLVMFLYGLVMTTLFVKLGGLLCTKLLRPDWPKFVYGGAVEEKQSA